MLRKIRTDKGLTLQNMATRVGTHHSRLSRIEQRKALPSFPLAVKISHEYGITLDQLAEALGLVVE